MRVLPGGVAVDPGIVTLGPDPIGTWPIDVGAWPAAPRMPSLPNFCTPVSFIPALQEELALELTWTEQAIMSREQVCSSSAHGRVDGRMDGRMDG